MDPERKIRLEDRVYCKSCCDAEVVHLLSQLSPQILFAFFNCKGIISMCSVREAYNNSDTS